MTDIHIAIYPCNYPRHQHLLYTIAQLGDVACVELHNYKLVNVTHPRTIVHSMHCLYIQLISALQYHLVLNLDKINHAMHFQQQLLINARMK